MRKSVILITIDSLRHDSVGFLNSNCKLTPYLDKLASKSTVMENAFSAGGGTIYAMSSLMTSSFPILNMSDKTIKGWPTLALSFRNQGYHTAGFHSNPWLSQPFGFDQGFDEFRYIVPSMRVEDVVDVGPLAKRIPEAINEFTNITIKDAPLWMRAEGLFREATRWLNKFEKSEPFFLWIHPMDIHFPYTHPTTALKRLSPARMMRYGIDFLSRYSKNNFINSIGRKFSLIEEYRASIRYMDSVLENFCEENPDALIVIMADHGDLFGEHGYYQHPGELYNEIIKVPILLHDGSSHHKVIQTNFSTVETGDLIKSFARGDSDDNGPRFHEMFSIHVDYNTAVRRTSVVRGHWKLIMAEDTRTKKVIKTELYDIGRDPREVNDLGPANPNLLQDLIGIRTEILKAAEKQKLKLSMRRLAPLLQKRTIN